MSGPPYANFFEQLDAWLLQVADPLEAAREVLAPDAELVMNELIPVNNAWCNKTHRPHCDAKAWMWASSAGAGPDRKGLGWNAAAAAFAYGYGKLAERGWKYVGADQLVGGTYPDNFASVASLDWKTGQPNAKYWAVRMLATELGTGRKTLFNTSSNRTTALLRPATMRRSLADRNS